MITIIIIIIIIIVATFINKMLYFLNYFIFLQLGSILLSLESVITKDLQSITVDHEALNVIERFVYSSFLLSQQFLGGEIHVCRCCSFLCFFGTSKCVYV